MFVADGSGDDVLSPPPLDTGLDDLEDLTQVNVDDLGPPPSEFLVKDVSVVEPPPGYLQQEQHESPELGHQPHRA